MGSRRIRSSALVLENVELVPSEYRDDRHVRHTPTDPAFADRALFFPWGEFGASGVVTGFADSVCRGEGCA